MLLADGVPIISQIIEAIGGTHGIPWVPELHHNGAYRERLAAVTMRLQKTRAQRRFDNIKNSAARSLERDRAQKATVLFAFRDLIQRSARREKK